MKLFNVVLLTIICIFSTALYAETSSEQLKNAIGKFDKFYAPIGSSYQVSIRECRAQKLSQQLNPEQVTLLLEMIEKSKGKIFVASTDQEDRLIAAAWYYRSEIDCVLNNPQTPKETADYARGKENTLDFLLKKISP